jgi:hypothetical protein
MSIHDDQKKVATGITDGTDKQALIQRAEEAFAASQQQEQGDTKRPIESDYTSQVAYTRALEAYCDKQEQDIGGCMSKESLKLALEVLQELNETQTYWWQEVGETTIAKIGPTIKALEEALKQEQGEPVIDKSAAIRIATTLGWEPKRTWVGLTDVEWMNIVNKDQAWFGQRPDEVAHEVAKLVEAKLKEKNNTP